MSEANIVYGKSANSTGPVVTIGTNADKTFTAADIAAAEERGRREGLRDALKSYDAIRWWRTLTMTGERLCAECNSPKANPEVHSASCKIGKLVALLDAKEAADDTEG